MEFLQALTNADMPFLFYALLVGLLASISFGIMGSYVVARRISYIAGAIAHSVLGGIGIALYFKHAQDVAWSHPMAGAIIAALVSALVIGWVSLYAKEREDTVIGALWAIGMAIGVLFLSKTPGYVDPMSYLFGNILLITQKDLWIVAGLDLIVVGVSLFCYNYFLAVCFDEEFARLRGLRVEFYYLLLLCLTALTIVLLVRVVGIVMVIALLTLPAATAGQFTSRLWKMMIWAIVFCAGYTVIGLATSYSYNMPAGPMIIMVAGVCFLGSMGVRLILQKNKVQK